MHADKQWRSTPRLVTENLQLRPWRKTDAAGLAQAVHESVASVGRWLPWCHAGYTQQDATAWIARCQAGWRSGVHFAFAVTAADSGELLGAAGLSRHDRLRRCANLGYWVRQSHQRQGTGTAAARLVARFGFTQLELIRIEVVILPGNAPSRAVAKRIGATFETMARSRLWARGQAHDAAVYGLIAQDLL